MGYDAAAEQRRSAIMRLSLIFAAAVCAGILAARGVDGEETCTKGQYWNSETTSCEFCSPGQFQDADKHTHPTCKKCNPKKDSGEGAPGCYWNGQEITGTALGLIISFSGVVVVVGITVGCNCKDRTTYRNNTDYSALSQLNRGDVYTVPISQTTGV